MKLIKDQNFAENGVPAAGTDEMISPNFSVSSVFGDAMEIFKARWKIFLAIGAIFFVFGFLQAITGFLLEIGTRPARLHAEISQIENPVPANGVPAEIVPESNKIQNDVPAESSTLITDKILGFSSNLPIWEIYLARRILRMILPILSFIFTFGVLQMTQKIDHGEPTTLRDAFPLGKIFRKIPSFIVLAFWWILIFAVPAAILVACVFSEYAFPQISENYEWIFGISGLLLGCAIIYFMWRLCMSSYVIFLEKISARAAIEKSWQITRGRFWRVFLLSFLLSLLTELGEKFTFYFANIFLEPYLLIFYAIIYFKLVKNSSEDSAVPVE